MSFAAFLIVALAGLLVGVLSGMFGIGGGTMIVPLLNLVFSVPMTGATSTSLFVIAPTAISGMFRHVKQKTADVKLGLLIGLSGALTSALGAWLSEDLPDLILVIITSLVILYSAFQMFRSSSKKLTDVSEASFGLSPEANPAPAEPATPIKPKLVTRKVVIAVVLGLFAGLIAGLVGVGGGFIIVPMSIALLGFSMHRAAGTSLLAIAIIAIPGIISHALLGHIWYLHGLALLVGTIPGAQLGARLAARIPDRSLRLAFGVVLVFSGSMLLVNQLFL